KRQADAAEKQIGIAKDTEERQLRAYVFDIRATMRDFAIGKKPNVRITIKNVGQTPAYNVRFRGGIKPVPSNFSGSFPLISDNANRSVGPGVELYPVLTADEVLTDTVNMTVHNGVTVYLVSGIIDYTDAFDQPRFKNFRLVFDRESICDGALTMTPDGNDGN